jgi:hypothetical protein
LTRVLDRDVTWITCGPHTKTHQRLNHRAAGDAVLHNKCAVEQRIANESVATFKSLSEVDLVRAGAKTSKPAVCE